jgi:hypothetical protein
VANGNRSRKIVINSAYGYLGAGGMTRFADLAAAAEGAAGVVWSAASPRGD